MNNVALEYPGSEQNAQNLRTCLTMLGFEVHYHSMCNDEVILILVLIHSDPCSFLRGDVRDGPEELFERKFVSLELLPRNNFFFKDDSQNFFSSMRLPKNITFFSTESKVRKPD